MAPSANARTSPQSTCCHLADSQQTNGKYVSYPIDTRADIGKQRTDHEVNGSDSLEYWRKRLASVTPTNFPLRSSSSCAIVDSSVLRRFSIAYENLTRDHGIELSTLVTLAYALVLNAHSGSSDEVVFGHVRRGQR
jgi:hypothetical protein